MSVKAIVLCLKGKAVLVFMLFFQFSIAQQDFGSLEKVLEKNKDELGPYFSIAIAKDGKDIYVKNNGNEFNINSQVPIANASKWLTSAMIMSLVEKGIINLDDKVSKYIPIFEKYRKGYITLRHCFTHQSGLEQDQFKASGNKKFENLEEEVNYIASNSEIETPPGEFFYFGNAGLNIVARVCEIVTKKSFEQLMSDKIFKPLQMRSTNFTDGSTASNPSGSAVSSVKDFTTFLTMILNKGQHKGKQVLSEASIAEMHKLQMNVEKVKFTPEGLKGIGHGYGVWLIETNEKGEATAVAAPGLFCNWAFIDLCRGYSCVVFEKKLFSQKRFSLISQLKAALDDIIPSNCK